jgi:hypothetical protein
MQGIRLLAAVLATLVVCGTGIALGAQGDSEGDVEGTVAPQTLSAPPENDPGVELASKRTATSETFRLPGGALQTRVFETPINYRDTEGNWKPIGEDLEELPGGGLSNGSNRFDVSLPERLGADPVRLSIDGQWVSAELLGHESEAAQLEAGAASYELPAAGTSFELTGLANGLKEDIEIAGPADPSTFEFELRASAGLHPVLSEEGSIEFREGEGPPVVVLPAPMMLDGAPRRPGVSGVAHYELRPQPDDAWRLAVIADRDWLEAKDRSWPVRIDPTLEVPSPSLDCWIDYNEQTKGEGAGGCGSSGQQWLYTADPVEMNWLYRSLLRFNLTQNGLNIPSGAEVTSATLGV